MIKQCPVCKRKLKIYCTWRSVLYAIFCFPCNFLGIGNKKQYRCKECDIEVVIADGTIPSVARTYKMYSDFKWQFQYHYREAIAAATASTRRKSSRWRAKTPEIV